MSIFFVGLFIFELNRRRLIVIRKNKEKQELHTFYQEKFDRILEENSNSNKEIQKAEGVRKEESHLDISEDVVAQIIKSLKSFETKQFYRDSSITATSLALEMGTNANYLARVIKFTFGKNFKTYINDLRIAYVLTKLRDDKTFRNYSVNAMAQEAGFKNTAPFSRSFKDRTGLYPSDFINKLENLQH